MKAVGRSIRNGGADRLFLDRRVEQIDLPAAQSAADPPSRLLWSIGIIAAMLSIAAFLLWGINGASTLFDMMAALCS
jgi:hypothetical protein